MRVIFMTMVILILVTIWVLVMKLLNSSKRTSKRRAK